MSIPNHGGSSGRRPLPLSPPPDGRNGDAAETRPATLDQWPAPPVDRPGRPRFDGWAGPPPSLNGEKSENGTEPRPRRWPLVLAALGLVATLGVVAVVVGAAQRGSEAPTEVGTVRSADGAQVRTREGAEPRALEEGETVLYGWTVEADVPGVVVDLAAGGVLRFDAGAQLSFTATDGSGGGDPTVHIDGGRTWFNPAGVPESEALVLAADDVRLRSTGPPVAVDCTIDCTAEAPAGGVKVSTRDGVNVAPATDEAVMVTSDGGLVMRTIDEPSPWVQENVDADAAALPPPTTLPRDGVTAGAVPAGAYALDVAVTGDGTGVALNPSVTWRKGQTEHFDAVVDAEPCPQVPCDVLVTATLDRDGTTLAFDGTLHIEGRSAALTLTRPLDCPAAPSGTPARSVGTSTVTADLTVSEAAYDKESGHWIATVMGGSGSASVEITDPTCETVPNPTGALSNALEMTGHAAG